MKFDEEDGASYIIFYINLDKVKHANMYIICMYAFDYIFIMEGEQRLFDFRFTLSITVKKKWTQQSRAASKRCWENSSDW